MPAPEICGGCGQFISSTKRVQWKPIKMTARLMAVLSEEVLKESAFDYFFK